MSKSVEVIREKWSDSLRVGIKSGVCVNNVIDASQFARVIREIRQKTGQCNPSDLVEASRPDDAESHPLFEWNDGLAAERYREEQSRHALRCHVVVYKNPQTDQEAQVRTFVSVRREDNTRTYEETLVAVQTEEDRDRILNRCLAELCQMRRRWQQFSTLADVVSAIDKVVDHVRVKIAED